jgi:hypothetical protein
MDLLSIIASYIAIIQIADRLVSNCKGYVKSVKDTPNNIRIIIIEVGSVRCVLELIRDPVPEDGDDNNDMSFRLQNLRGEDGPVEGCKKALIALSSLDPDPVVQSTHEKRRKLFSLTTLAWPLKEGKARKLLQDIRRYKATMSLALTTETV